MNTNKFNYTIICFNVQYNSNNNDAINNNNNNNNN